MVPASHCDRVVLILGVDRILASNRSPGGLLKGTATFWKIDISPSGRRNTFLHDKSNNVLEGFVRTCYSENFWLRSFTNHTTVTADSQYFR